MERTCRNAELTINDVNKKVVLVGWVSKRRNLGSILFIDLRDRSGIVQIMVKNVDESLDIRNEYVLQVYGTVSKRETPNPKLKTGEIEISTKYFESHSCLHEKALRISLLLI